MKGKRHIQSFNEATENLNISDEQRELLISFFTWVREDYRGDISIEDISAEYLVDYWLKLKSWGETSNVKKRKDVKKR